RLLENTPPWQNKKTEGNTNQRRRPFPNFNRNKSTGKTLYQAEVKKVINVNHRFHKHKHPFLHFHTKTLK
ncbi:hypothetical protein, partial [Lacticaseibacillus paracasei]|uniref:hypothetical protein n=1 Tax=Lacticaseibacillus paracasei TaxID=1597 RepID=UPI002E2FB04D